MIGLVLVLSKKHLETEVMVHQVTNVIELGWEPATENKPGLLS